MNEKELIGKEAEKMRVTLKARLLPNLPLDENEPLLKPRTHVTKIINTMEFDWHLNEMFKAGQDNVTEIVTNLFEREDYKLGFKAGQLNPHKTCVVCMKDVSDGSININFPNTLGIKKGLPFCSMECEDVVNGMIKANKDESFKAGQDNKKNLRICQDNAHNMEWVCSICGLVEDSKHSHKTCIIKFDERVQKAQQDTAKRIFEEIYKLYKSYGVSLLSIALVKDLEKELIEDDRCIKSLKLLKSNWGDKE